MKKRWLIILAVVCVVGIVFARRTPPKHGVVYRITVEGQGETMVYTAQDKMSWILNGLRQLGQKTLAHLDPEQLSVTAYRITLERTDGKTTVYHTKGERFLRKDEGPWMQTDPQALSDLLLILQHLPSD